MSRMKNKYLAENFMFTRTAAKLAVQNRINTDLSQSLSTKTVKKEKHCGILCPTFKKSVNKLHYSLLVNGGGIKI